MRIYGLISVTIIKSGQQTPTKIDLRIILRLQDRTTRSFNIIPNDFSKKKNVSTFQNNNPFHSKFHKPFTIYNESIKYHALNKFPTRSNQRISSRETLPFRINNNGIYSFFFLPNTTIKDIYAYVYTIVHDEGEGRLIWSS